MIVHTNIYAIFYNCQKYLKEICKEHSIPKLWLLIAPQGELWACNALIYCFNSHIKGWFLVKLYYVARKGYFHRTTTLTENLYNRPNPTIRPSIPSSCSQFCSFCLQIWKKRKNKKKIKNRKIHLGIARPNDKESKKWPVPLKMLSIILFSGTIRALDVGILK